MPSTAQAEQLNQFVSQPINNLIVFLAIIALIIVLSCVFVIWKFAPMLYNLFKQQADTNKQTAETNSKLTNILEESEKRAEQRTVALEELGEKTDTTNAELSKQTSVIDAGRIEQRQFNLLITKDMSVHAEGLGDIQRGQDAILAKLDEVSQKLDQVIQDKADCMKLRDELSEFKGKVEGKFTEQDKRSADSQPIIILPPNVSPDTPPASEPPTEDGKREAA